MLLEWGIRRPARGKSTTVEEACEECTRAVHESGTSGAGWCTRGARDYAVVHEIAEWFTSTSAARWCTRLRSGARDCGVVHDGTRVEVRMARQREVPRQLRKLVSGAREQCTRVVRVEPMVHERCTRLVVHGKDARVGCTRWVHEYN